MSFNRIGILGHPLRPEAGEICDQVEHSLKLRGVDAWQRKNWDATLISSQIEACDLIIAIGGDGAMLKAARLCAKANVPVFGINAGHLGFLTEVSPNMWDDALELLLSGNYWVEQRMMIRSEAWRGNTLLNRENALNDVVISRGAVARSVLLETYIDREWATTYNADGLIVATPTGSTAYGLAAGGPILPPELKNILVMPVAAHLSFDRPLVLSEGSTVEVVVAKETQADVVLNVDGDTVTMLQIGDSVVIHASEYLSKFVRLRDHNYFYRSILDRVEPRIPIRREPDQRTRPLTRETDTRSL
jgi:NAD+ kinase